MKYLEIMFRKNIIESSRWYVCTSFLKSPIRIFTGTKGASSSFIFTALGAS